ncbi:MAG TPA: sulfatase-like hydrolase/transferase [Planctomycetota bacterium]|nr:sulfatase-like hydrolase/transferase [Planctomycetota bacterium]
MPRQPNVIVFFTDQQRWDCSGLHGNPLDLMPNFDRLATRGTHVYHSYTCQPVCGPARACLQTGTYATTNGSWRNGIPLNKSFKTLAQCFKEGGYQTGYIGKWHLSEHEPVPKEDRAGYDYWLASNVLEFTSDAYDCNMYDGEGKKVHLPGYRVDAQTDAVIRYIDAHQDKPFFLFTSYIEPHFQNHTDDYPAPDGYRERYLGRWIPPDLAEHRGSTHQHIAGYYGMVKRLDEALGRIHDALKSLKLERDTIVLFTSDHGCHFKTRNSEYKRSCHDSSIRVPTALWGGPFESGGSLRHLVSLVDLPPTLLDACGLPIPKQMQGRSILPLTRGQREGWPEEVLVQISESQIGRAVRTQRWKYCVVAQGVGRNAQPSADKYTEDALYDLECDPYELRNLIDIESHRKVAEVMRGRLLKRMEQAGEKRPEILPPKTIKAAGQRRVSDEEALM